MADITEKNASGSTKIVGSDLDGNESNFTEVTANNELKNHDVFDNGWLSTTLNIAAGSTVELKIGGSVLADRKGIFLQAKDKNITWGHSNAVTPFSAFKDQFFSLPIGDGSPVWITNNGATAANVVIGELA